MWMRNWEKNQSPEDKDQELNLASGEKRGVRRPQKAEDPSYAPTSEEKKTQVHQINPGPLTPEQPGLLLDVARKSSSVQFKQATCV